MITVHKFTLTPNCRTINVNQGAKLRACHEQRGDICLWFEVNTTQPTEERNYEIFGTGHEIPNQPDDYAFVGTVFIAGGSLVFHVYERA